MARILVIDDDPTIYEFARIVLEEDSHEVVGTTDSTAALEMIENQRFDLVITDIFMPEPNGIQIIMKLNLDFPQVKIIAISGGGSSESIDYFTLVKNLGARQALKKPLTQEALSHAVREVLS